MRPRVQCLKPSNNPSLDELLVVAGKTNWGAKGYIYLVSETNKKKSNSYFEKLETSIWSRYRSCDRISYQTSRQGEVYIIEVSDASTQWLARHGSDFYPTYLQTAQDLSFLRPDGSVWFHSVTHEDHCWFCLSKKEQETIELLLEKQDPFLLSEDSPGLVEEFSKDRRSA